jgi:hypothetical protein
MINTFSKVYSVLFFVEECFFDKVTSGTKMSLMFEVAEGGFLDIDIKVSYITCKNFIPFSNCQSADKLIGKYNSFTLYLQEIQSFQL